MNSLRPSERCLTEHELDIICAYLPLTDQGNAVRFFARFGDRFLWVPQRQQWLAYDGTRWKCDPEKFLAAWHETVNAIRREAATLDEPWGRHARRRT